MLKVKSGDLDKMALLFHRYHRPLYGFLFYMTGERETSEDMVQNVFYRMLRSRHTFTGEGEFRTWMYHLARNVWKDHIKSHTRTGTYQDLATLPEPTSHETPADEQLDQKLEIKALQKAIACLSPENREVLILSRFQELRHAEIARVLDINVGAVKVRIHRALNQLKALCATLEIKT